MPMRNRPCTALSQTPVLTPPLLSRIQQLNLEYLQLVSAPTLNVCAHAEAMPGAVRQALAGLPPSTLQLIAAAPYALFSLAFEDQDLWLATLSDADLDTCGLQVADSASAACPLRGHAAFCETVIFFAWHVAVANRLAARMALGMPAAVIERLQPTSFRKLQHVMRAAPWLLTPRWPSNPRFWPDLLKCAARGEPEAVKAAQLLGSQLIASDLRIAESPQPEVAGRLRAARYAQQQRWKVRPR